MSTILKTALAAAALLAAAPAAAQPADLGRYDARQARSLAEQLVLCDLAGYFKSGPDLNAQRLVLRRSSNDFEPSLPAAITRGGDWYDDDLKRAYFRYSATGRVAPAEVHAARYHYGREMEDVFRRTSYGERRFFQDQAPFCRNLARSAWR